MKKWRHFGNNIAPWLMPVRQSLRTLRRWSVHCSFCKWKMKDDNQKSLSARCKTKGAVGAVTGHAYNLEMKICFFIFLVPIFFQFCRIRLCVCLAVHKYIFFLKVWWQAATLFIYFTLSEHTYNIYIYNSSRTASCNLHRFRSVEGLLYDRNTYFTIMAPVEY
jgi:hypothetical protein